MPKKRYLNTYKITKTDDNIYLEEYEKDLTKEVIEKAKWNRNDSKEKEAMIYRRLAFEALLKSFILTESSKYEHYGMPEMYFSTVELRKQMYLMQNEVIDKNIIGHTQEEWEKIDKEMEDDIHVGEKGEIVIKCVENIKR